MNWSSIIYMNIICEHRRFIAGQPSSDNHRQHYACLADAALSPLSISGRISSPIIFVLERVGASTFTGGAGQAADLPVHRKCRPSCRAASTQKVQASCRPASTQGVQAKLQSCKYTGGAGPAADLPVHRKCRPSCRPASTQEVQAQLQTCHIHMFNQIVFSLKNN